MLNTIRKSFELLEKKDRNFLISLMFLMLVAMTFEFLSLGSLIPLIDYFTESNLLPSVDSTINSFLSKFEAPKENLLSNLVIIILCIFIIKNLFLLFFHWYETKIVALLRAKISLRLFNKYLNEDYKFYLEKNSYEISANVIHETTVFGAFFLSVSLLFTEIFLLLGVIFLIFIINPVTTSVLLALVGILGFIFYVFFKKEVKSLGGHRKLKEKDKQNILQQGLSTLREIMIFKAQDFFVEKFNNESLSVAKIYHKFAFITKLPKVWLETFAILLVVLLIFLGSYFGVNEKKLLAYISLGILALVRMLPSANRIINSMNFINFSKQAIDNLYSEIITNKKITSPKVSKSINFNTSIKLNNLDYKFTNSSKFLLKDLNLEIKKNEKIGIMGETGSGKSTLINIMAGLVKPSSGEVKIDNQNLENVKENWLDKISYVGQSSSFFEGSIANNIAFGISNEKIDNEKLNNVINLAGLKGYVSRQPNGTDSFIKESGKNLSGGEAQRISIARALYKNPEVIIFDEPTSSLDSSTEEKIILSIEKFSKNRTIIFVSHKKTTLKFCNKIYQLKNQRLEEIKI